MRAFITAFVQAHLRDLISDLLCPKTRGQVNLPAKEMGLQRSSSKDHLSGIKITLLTDS